jgi:hypothetical protein
MNFIEKETIRTKSHSNIWLTTESTNQKAQIFYERHGFSKIGEVRDSLVSGKIEFLYFKSFGPLFEINFEKTFEKMNGSL